MQMLKKIEAPLIWTMFFLLLGGTVGLNVPFVLLIIAIIIHLL